MVARSGQEGGDAYDIPSPDRCTEAYVRFLRRINMTSIFAHTGFRSITNKQLFVEEIAQVIEGSFEKMPDGVTQKDADIARRIREGTPSPSVWRPLVIAFAELIHCRVVDVYLLYLGDLATEIHTSRPETLRNQEQVTYEEVLAHESMDSLILHMVEQRVSKLSRSGFRDLAKDFDNRLGVSLTSNDDEYSRINIAVAVRNLFVHRAGKTDRQFLRAISPGTASGAGAGTELATTPNAVLRNMAFIATSALALDDRAAAKFGLHLVDPVDVMDWPEIVKDLIGKPEA